MQPLSTKHLGGLSMPLAPLDPKNMFWKTGMTIFICMRATHLAGQSMEVPFFCVTHVCFYAQSNLLKTCSYRMPLMS